MTNEEHEAGKIRDTKIREMRAGGMIYLDIAKEWGLTAQRVSQICGITGSVKARVPSRYLTVYLSYETIDAIKARVGGKDGKNISRIVENAISDYLKKVK